jgi:hypothetical protein
MPHTLYTKKVFEDGFAPFLEQLVPRLVDAANTSDGNNNNNNNNN